MCPKHLPPSKNLLLLNGIYSLHSVPWQKCLCKASHSYCSLLWIHEYQAMLEERQDTTSTTQKHLFQFSSSWLIFQNCRTPMQPVIPTPCIISQLLQKLLPSHVAHPSGPAKELSTFSSSKSIKPNFWRLLNTNSGSIQLYGRRHVGSAKFKQVSSPVTEEGKCWGSTSWVCSLRGQIKEYSHVISQINVRELPPEEIEQSVSKWHNMGGTTDRTDHAAVKQPRCMWHFEYKFPFHWSRAWWHAKKCGGSRK